MTLDEICDKMAQELGLRRVNTEPDKVQMDGRNATLWVMPFFGGWQIDVELPERPRIKFFEEDHRMLVQRVDQRLKAYLREREELEQAAKQGRPRR